ncbi:MAG: hypothetical protein GTN69_12360 [Armatimonadetes bacterium]|nr:hypothetical protein [Armatimonadota bacterium]
MAGRADEANAGTASQGGSPATAGATAAPSWRLDPHADLAVPLAAYGRDGPAALRRREARGMTALLVTAEQRDAIRNARHDRRLDTATQLILAVLDGDDAAVEALQRYWPGLQLRIKRQHRVRVTAKVMRQLRKRIPSRYVGLSDHMDSATTGLDSLLSSEEGG